VDFLRLPASASTKYLMGYLPFVLLQWRGRCCGWRHSASASSHPQASCATPATQVI